MFHNVIETPRTREELKVKFFTDKHGRAWKRTLTRYISEVFVQATAPNGIIHTLTRVEDVYLRIHDERPA